MKIIIIFVIVVVIVFTVLEYKLGKEIRDD